MYFDTSQKLAVMSIGFLLQNKDDAVVWRGPKKNCMILYLSIAMCNHEALIFDLAMIKQFLTDVIWGDRDYLIIDTPPGTTDEHITLVEQLQNGKLDGAIVVTTPQVNASRGSILMGFIKSGIDVPLIPSEINDSTLLCGGRNISWYCTSWYFNLKYVCVSIYLISIYEFHYTICYFPL